VQNNTVFLIQYYFNKTNIPTENDPGEVFVIDVIKCRRPRLFMQLLGV
jgi:hypothetical protein